MKLQHYVCGEWREGEGERTDIRNPATGETIADVKRGGIHYEDALSFGREKGNPALREMTFEERAECLQGLANVIHENREDLLDLSVRDGGNTRSDAKFDVDGAMFALSHYADLGKELGDRPYLSEGEVQQAGRSARYAGGHLKIPFKGVAVQINAFNFPAWGMAEKAATSLLAGMPIAVKPATKTAPVAYRIARSIVDRDILPEGGFTFFAGGRGSELVNALTFQDVLSFTGSGGTGAIVRGADHVRADSIRVNVEADSVNGVVLAPDVEPGSDGYNQFLRDAITEMTQKAGQKCTATRRIFVPEERLETVREDLVAELSDLTVGDPSREDVDMGPVISADQRTSVREGIEDLKREADLVYAGEHQENLTGTSTENGHFVRPHLLQAADAESLDEVHTREIFGPVATLIPFSGEAERGGELLGKGGGSLVSTVYSDDPEYVETIVQKAAPYSGRVVIGGERVADKAPSPGMVSPVLVHGGPGKAGGGEELGGLIGLEHYLQRTGVQGFRPLVERLHDAGADEEK